MTQANLSVPQKLKSSKMMLNQFFREGHDDHEPLLHQGLAEVHAETPLTCCAKKAALQEKIKFSSVISELESKLEHFKIHKQFEEIAAQKAVYKREIDEESELDIEKQPLLPTALHDPIDAFLNSNEETKLTIIASEATILNTERAYKRSAVCTLLASFAPIMAAFCNGHYRYKSSAKSLVVCFQEMIH